MGKTVLTPEEIQTLINAPFELRDKALLETFICSGGKREEIAMLTIADIEIAESIIDEKWEELMKAVDKIVVWKESTEKKMTQMEQKMDDLRNEFDALHKGVLGKVEEYDRGIKEVGTDIKAMEEVFKKTLPTFTENIHELSRLTKNIKSKKKKTV